MTVQDEVRDDAFRGTRPADADPVGELFASRSVAVHLVRGVLGALLVVGGLVLSAQTAWALLAVIPGIVAWRGCPTCWTMGLIATISRGRVASGATCAR